MATSFTKASDGRSWQRWVDFFLVIYFCRKAVSAAPLSAWPCYETLLRLLVVTLGGGGRPFYQQGRDCLGEGRDLIFSWRLFKIATKTQEQRRRWDPDWRQHQTDQGGYMMWVSLCRCFPTTISLLSVNWTQKKKKKGQFLSLFYKWG